MLKNINIGKKLLLFFLIVAIISSIGNVVGICVMKSLDTNYKNALVSYGFAQGTVGRISSEFNSVRATMRDIDIKTDQTVLQKDFDALDQSEAKINQYLATLKSQLVNAKETEYFNTIQTNMTAFNAAKKQGMALAKENKKAESDEYLTTNASPLVPKISDAINSLLELKTSTGNQLSSDLSMQANISMIIMIAITLVALIVSIIIAILIARSISRPVVEIEQAAKELAKGNLNIELHTNESNNEIGQLNKAFTETIATLKAYITDLSMNLSKMAAGDLRIERTVEYKGNFIQIEKAMTNIVHSFNDAMVNIKQAAEQVSSGSEQVSSGAQSLAQGATEQASSVEELSATITEISSHIKENATHAADASMKVNQVSDELKESNQQMQEMISAMSKINNSSNEIGKIIKSIEDIAFQTNILALNAAVEAARAGEAGKGFAVVADEVRNLASKSAEAAKNTTVLIQNSMQEVENGTKIADTTADALLQVVEHAADVADKVNHISEISNRQANSIGQVTLGVEQISSVVQTNSATAEESAAASEELSEQAETMKALVEKFKLREETATQTTHVELKQEKEGLHTNSASTIVEKEIPAQISSNNKYE